MKSIYTNFKTTQATIGITPTLIFAERAGRDTVTIEQTGVADVYIGGSDVSTTTGLLLPGVVGASISLGATAAVYGIVASGTQVVCAVETF